MNPRILVLTLSTFAFGSTAFIFAGVLETMAQDLGVATAVAGQLQTSYVLVSALLGPPLAWLLGKADRKVVLAAALGFGFSACCVTDILRQSRQPRFVVDEHRERVGGIEQVFGKFLR